MLDYLYLAAVLAMAIWLFWTRRIRPDMTAVMVMLLLVVPWPHPGGWRAVLPPEKGFAGFGSAAVLMIAGMFILGRSLVRTGAAEAIGLRILRAVSGHEWLLQLAVLVLATFASMFINDTTVVLILLPLIAGICREKNLSPSRYLLFAAYGSLLGGQWTLIGTRSNILISDFLRNHTGHGIGFFAFTPLAAAVFAGSAVFLMLVGRHLLPDHRPSLPHDLMKEFLTEVDVPEESGAIGQRPGAVDALTAEGVAVVAHLRDGRPVPDWSLLAAGDVLLVRGTVENIGGLIKSSDFRVVEESTLDDTALESVDLVTVEAVVPVNSPFVGLTLERASRRGRFGIPVVGLARHGHPVGTRIMDSVLEGGDSILLLGSAADVALLRERPGLLVLQDRDFPALGRRKAWTTAALLAGVVALAVSGLLAPSISIPIAAMLAILLGSITWRGAYESIDWPTLVTLGAMISFGTALEESGAATAIADLAVRYVSGGGAVILLAGLLLVAILFTQVIENAAVAIIMAPIAWQVAQATGLNPRPVMVALAVCISAGFSTPVAHESTILVLGPGQYEFRHYLLIGGALTVITWVTVTLLTPVLLGLR